MPSQTFSTPGDDVFTWPANVDSAIVELWGSGGGGGSAFDFVGGNGGGGGGYAIGTISRGMNTTENVHLGAGGTRGGENHNNDPGDEPTAGDATWFRDSSTLFGNGGGAGANAADVGNHEGGAGGTAGGSAATSSASGTAGDGNIAGLAGDGGVDGAGNGGFGAGGSAFDFGGAGANGKIIVRWRGLNFATQPSSVAAGAAMSPSPAVEVLDEYDVRDTSATDSITLAIGDNPGGSTLTTSTNPKSAASGLATFNSTSLDHSGIAYTLTASASGLAGATSDVFDILAAAAFPIYFRRKWRPHRRKRWPWELRAVRTIIIPSGFTVRTQPVPQRLRQQVIVNRYARRGYMIPQGFLIRTQPVPQRLRQQVPVNRSTRRGYLIPGGITIVKQPVPVRLTRRVTVIQPTRRVVAFPGAIQVNTLPLISCRVRTPQVVTRRTKMFLPPVTRALPLPLPAKVKRMIEPRTRRIVATFQTLLFRSPIFLAGKQRSRVETRTQRRFAFVVVPQFPATTIFMPGKTRQVTVSRTRRLVTRFPTRPQAVFLPGKKRLVEKTRIQRNLVEVVTRSPALPIILPPRRVRSIELRSRRYTVPVMMRPFPQTAIFSPGRRIRVVETRRQRCFGIVPLRLLPTQPIALPRKILRREIAGVRVRKFVPLPVAGASTQSPVFLRRTAVALRPTWARSRAWLPIASTRTVPLPGRRTAVSSRIVITRRAVAPVLASPARLVCVPVRRIRERVLGGRRVVSLLPTASAPLPIFLPPKRIFRTIERRRLSTRTFPARLVQNVTIRPVKKTW